MFGARDCRIVGGRGKDERRDVEHKTRGRSKKSVEKRESVTLLLKKELVGGRGHRSCRGHEVRKGGKELQGVGYVVMLGGFIYALKRTSMSWKFGRPGITHHCPIHPTAVQVFCLLLGDRVRTWGNILRGLTVILEGKRGFENLQRLVCQSTITWGGEVP